MTGSAPLDGARWDEFAALLEAALALPPDERDAYLDHALSADPAARVQLQTLLAAADSGAMRGLEEWLVRDTPLAHAPLEAGARIGAYRVVARVGEGGMGEVYRGERVDGAFEQEVAIKVLRAGLATTELVRRFEIERRILARLTHPGIVGIIDGGTTSDGRPYLVMPFVEGTSITTWCETTGASLERRLRLFLEVAAAVQHAHVALVVHRDIKPSNILVSAPGTVRLLDFGIAKLLAAPDDHGHEGTRSALRLLTPEHAAPEQVRGEAVSTATDIYALGVLLYELVSGARPHRLDGRTMRELEQEILDVVPPPPSVAARQVAWGRRIRGDLDRIVLQALRKEPASRYPSVGQLADDVERYLKGLPVSAERDRWMYRARKFVRRNRVAVAASGAAIVSLVAFAIGMTLQARAVARERDHARQERQATESVVQMLTSLFSLANPTVVPGGDTLRVSQLLALGDSLIDSLHAQPALQARMWKVIGEAQLARGRVEEGERALRLSYDRLQRAPDADSLEVARTLHELARAVDTRAGRAKSLPLFEESVRRLALVRGISPVELGVAQRDLAERMLDRDVARQVLERAMKPTPLRSAGDSMEHAAALNALANDRYGNGRLREAVALYEETVRILDGLIPPEHPTQLLVRGNLATMHRDLGDLGLAEGMSREILRVVRAQGDGSPLGEASALERLAGTLAMRGFLEEAERGYDEALLLERRAVEPAHGMIVWNRYSQAVVRGARGRTDEAIATLDTVLAKMRGGGFTDVDSLQAVDLRAAYLLEGERFDEALALLARTARPLASAVSWPHPAREAHAQLEGLAALAGHHDEAALGAFDDALRSQRGRLPDGHPEVAGNQCGRAIALRRMGRGREATPALRDACARYRAFGLHLRLLARWGMQERALLEGDGE